jgi:hypothetical protein
MYGDSGSVCHQDADIETTKLNYMLHLNFAIRMSATDGTGCFARAKKFIPERC